MLNIILKYTHKYIHVNIHILYISIYLNTPVSIFFGQGFSVNVGAFCPKDLSLPVPTIWEKHTGEAGSLAGQAPPVSFQFPGLIQSTSLPRRQHKIPSF